MPDIKHEVGVLANKVRREGVKAAFSAVRDFSQKRIASQRQKKSNPDRTTFYDVLFINGCDYSVPHPIRYRVDHQIQQLEADGVSCNRVDAWNLTNEMVTTARVFVIFRCPCTEQIRDFIALAKKLNKRVLFDIDDLVVDTVYTDEIPFIQQMTESEKAQYDDGVIRMGETLKLCDAAITTTERLATELSKYVPEVFINRNVASEEMVYNSERALYERDVLPGLPEESVSAADMKYWRWAREHARENGVVTIGYFSGSITHNADFELVLPTLVKVLEERPEVQLHIVGDLSIPEPLARFEGRITNEPFCDWRGLPRRIASVDINIAPLEQTIFNEAKSENKWVEAALVKTPTVASNVGAFKKMIRDGETGILCDDPSSWYQALMTLVESREERERIGCNAYNWVKGHATTLTACQEIGAFIRKIETPNIGFMLPSLNISGGVLVAMKHAEILQRHGFDVMLMDDSQSEDAAPDGKLLEFGRAVLPVVVSRSAKNKREHYLLRGRIDQAVATMWSTVDALRQYPGAVSIQYLVQNFEPDFYQPSDPLRILANRTYSYSDISYLTVSKWCEDWLTSDWGHKVSFAPNGIETRQFERVTRKWDSGRIRILIEGDSESPYKNVDEAFRVVDQLDPSKYEIWYMSYNGAPKDKYRVDRFLHAVPHSDVGRVYGQCHILLKTSILESFSYPPLEMMATGGAVVVIKNDGNAEYLRDNENCIIFKQGDISAAVDAIERVVSDENLRSRLISGGIETAANRDWAGIASQIVELYK